MGEGVFHFSNSTSVTIVFSSWIFKVFVYFLSFEEKNEFCIIQLKGHTKKSKNVIFFRMVGLYQRFFNSLIVFLNLYLNTLGGKKKKSNT